jgi:hypothetical protein
MEKVTYSSDTTAAVPTANLIVARHFLAATGNSTAGYFGGGNAILVNRSTMDKVTYASDTTAASSWCRIKCCSLWSCRNRKLNSRILWWWYYPGSIDQQWIRSLIRSDTTAAVPGASLSAARRYLAATGNSDCRILWWWSFLVQQYIQLNG